MLLLCVWVDAHYCVDRLFTFTFFNQAVILSHTEYALQLKNNVQIIICADIKNDLAKGRAKGEAKGGGHKGAKLSHPLVYHAIT